VADASQTFQVPFKTMEAAVQGVVKFMGMTVCEQSDIINVTEKMHLLLLSGHFMASEHVLVRAQIGFNQEYGCVLKLTVRCTNKVIAQTILEAVN
jgi:coatomer protein complex subunit gamma